jgi:tRNA pseudouridine55 synthase
MNAVLIIDKPAGLTSHDVVARARRILKERSIGHLGTLDPMATGVLPLVVGSFTRLAQFYTGAEKVYEGVIRFGFSTDTYDAEGDPTSPPQPVTLCANEIEALAAKFRGVIQQVPPPFSAKKIQGVPAYKLARKHKEVVLEPVQVEIKEFELLSIKEDRVHFRARVASGTYMRSVAHDMGQAVGYGAHLESLRRTAVAEFTLADAHTLDELAARSTLCHPERSMASLQEKPCAVEGPAVVDLGMGAPLLAAVARSGKNETSIDGTSMQAAASPNPCHPAPQPCHPDRSAVFPEGKQRVVEGPAVTRHAASVDWEQYFVHPRRLLPQFPSVTADEATAARIRAGRTVNLLELSRTRQVKVFAGQRDLLAIATRVAGTLFHPKIVFASAESRL